MNSKEFFTEIYRNCTDGYITLTLLPSRKTLWFKPNEIEKMAKTAEHLGQKTNVYFGVGLRKSVLPNMARGNEKDIVCIPAFYADIDIKGDAHAQTSLPKTTDEAINFLNNLKIKPSIIVNSGNGIHSYWLLDKPFTVRNDEDRNQITKVFKSFGKYINSEALKLSWKLDNVYDLPRILRAPGSINHKCKNGAKCEVIQNALNRYTFEIFVQFVNSHGVGCIIGKNAQNIEKVLKNCEFIRYCQQNAETLPEPLWLLLFQENSKISMMVHRKLRLSFWIMAIGSRS